MHICQSRAKMRFRHSLSSLIAAGLLSTTVMVGHAFAAGQNASPSGRVVPNPIERQLADNGFDGAAVAALLQKTKAAFASANAEALSKIVHFPLRVNTPKGERISVRDPRELKAQARTIFSPSMRKVVADSQFGKLFVSAQGVMLGDGQIWFVERCPEGGRKCQARPMLIGSINVN